MPFTDLQRKLRFLPGITALIVNAPPVYLELLAGLNFDTIPDIAKQGKYDLVQVFGSEKSSMAKLVIEHSGSGKYDCLFWICYPKGGGKIKSVLSRNLIWEIAGSVGMQCVSQIAIDETWSALRCRPVEMVGK